MFYYVIDDEWVGFDNLRSIREKVNLNVLLMYICNFCDKILLIYNGLLK